MSAPLQIIQRAAGAVAILELVGPFIVDEGDLLLKDQVAALVSGGSRHVLLDLGHVTAMDSGGAGALAATLLHVARRGGSLKLLSPSERVLRVLQVTHLLPVFDVFDAESEALASFEGGAPAPVGDFFRG
jgi:anti-anti-sigma factor